MTEPRIILIMLFILGVLSGCGPSFYDQWECPEGSALIYGSNLLSKEPMCVQAVPAKRKAVPQ